MGLYSYDGHVSHLSAELGQKVSALIRPEKIVYQTDKTRCRQEPYNDILIKRILNIMETNCSQVCRPWYYWICNPNLERMFPVCSQTKNDDCFENAHFVALLDPILVKPCTKLQYPKESQHKVSNPNFRAEFALSFGKPALVAVKEEYLIYDLVSMIGAIGGTLGLCIGFSFNDACNFLLNHLESGISSCQNGNKVSQREIMIQQARNSFDTNRHPGQFVNLEARLDGLETNLQNRVEELEKRVLEVEQK